MLSLVPCPGRSLTDSKQVRIKLSRVKRNHHVVVGAWVPGIACLLTELLMCAASENETALLRCCPVRGWRGHASRRIGADGAVYQSTCTTASGGCHREVSFLPTGTADARRLRCYGDWGQCTSKRRPMTSGKGYMTSFNQFPARPAFRAESRTGGK